MPDATIAKAPSRRSSGILLHPSSLPGPFGIGDLGPAAYAWIDALAAAKQRCWQVLPLGPTGYADSPYQSFSTFAGNPYLISPEMLVRDGLLKREDLATPAFAAAKVDFGPVIEFKKRLLALAWDRFGRGAAPGLQSAFEVFAAANATWLDDYALFMAIKDTHGGVSWHEWPSELVLREPNALAAARRELAGLVGQHRFAQFLFFQQWQALRAHAVTAGVKLIGDIPIFVASDSADVWANPTLFFLDKRRRPAVVAGVPPDYFSATGQLWGNPLYNWQVLKETHYAWWVARIEATLQQVDTVRLDHFRGFEAYWEITAGMATAVIGHWVKGPGVDLFNTIRTKLGGLPLIAEDLGLITPEVDALRQELGLPGMRVLQFAFGGPSDNPYLPHNYEQNTIVYTGTHDNDTSRGWYQTATAVERDHYRRYAGRDGNDIAWDFIRLAWSSVADYAIAPLQDVLNLGPEGRMNRPGVPAGNWQWRFTEPQLQSGILERLAALTELYGRDPKSAALQEARWSPTPRYAALT